MTKNLSTVDRVFRAIVGIVLLVAPFVSGLAVFSGGVATTISVIVGLVLIGTAAVRFCPLYRVLGIQTCKL